MSGPTTRPTELDHGRETDGFATWGDADATRATRGRLSDETGFGTTVLPEVDRSSEALVLRDRSLPRFVPAGRLGEGGLGEVFAATDHDIGRTVAIKRIRSDRHSAGAVARFLREIRTVGLLEHANIIPIHDVGRDEDGTLYFVMRHIDGVTLEEVIDGLRAGDPEMHRRFGMERRVRIVAQVLEALAYAHAHGVVHRDVKPANVMVAKYGEVLLLDWGIARLLDAVDDDGEAVPASDLQTRVGAVIGTPAYMSPEQARGEPVDARSDLYSVAVMLHELLTLEHYLDDCADSAAMVEGVQHRVPRFAADVVSSHQGPVPAELAWFLKRALEKDPAARYPSAEAMLEVMARRAEGEIEIHCPVTFSKSVTGRALRVLEAYPGTVMAGAAAVGLLGLLGVLGLLLTVVRALGLAVS